MRLEHQRWDIWPLNKETREHALRIQQKRWVKKVICIFQNRLSLKKSKH